VLSTGTRVAVATAVLGAALLLIALVWLPWWEFESAGSIGLRSLELCHSGECVKRPLSQAGGSQMWSLLGIAALAAGTVSAVLLVAVGVRSWSRPAPRLSWLAGILSVFSALMAVGFVMTRPAFDGLEPGYGIAAFVAGAGLGAASAIRLSRG